MHYLEFIFCSVLTIVISPLPSINPVLMYCFSFILPYFLLRHPNQSHLGLRKSCLVSFCIIYIIMTNLCIFNGSPVDPGTRFRGGSRSPSLTACGYSRVDPLSQVHPEVLQAPEAPDQRQTKITGVFIIH